MPFSIVIVDFFVVCALLNPLHVHGAGGAFSQSVVSNGALIVMLKGVGGGMVIVGWLWWDDDEEEVFKI